MAVNYALRYFTLFCCFSLFGWSIASALIANNIGKCNIRIYLWFMLISMGFFTYAALMLIIQVKIHRNNADTVQKSLCKCLQFFLFLFILGLEMYGKFILVY